MTTSTQSVFFKTRETRIFRNRAALALDYLPDRLIHRDAQIGVLQRTLAPLLDGSKPSSILGLGVMGTGKTVTSRFVVEHFVEVSNARGLRILSTYVSCIADRTLYDVLYKAARGLAPGQTKAGHNRGYYLDLLQREIQQAAGFILILDEVDRLANRKTLDFSDLLYTLSRDFPRSSCIMLTGKRKVADILQHEIDGRTRDTLRWDPLDFPQYDAFQLRDILTPRVELAFQKGVCSEGVVNKICAVCVDQGLGARGTIEIARRIGEKAESRGEPVLREEDVDVAVHALIKRQIRGPVASLDRSCRGILAGLLERGSMSNKEMENYYSSRIAPHLKAGESREAFYYHLGHIRDLDLLTSFRVKLPHGRGSEGRLEIDPSQVEVLKEALQSHEEESC